MKADTFFNRSVTISQKIDKDIILYKNPVDETVSLFLFCSLDLATVNTPYHTFTGIDITDEVGLLNEHTFDADIFNNRTSKYPAITFRTSDNNWVWITTSTNQ